MDREKGRFPNPPDDDFPDASDDDNEDGNEISGELQAYLDDSRAWSRKNEDAMFRGAFERNKGGRHVLHQLAEDLRSPWYKYSRALWRETATITHLRVGLDTRTTGRHPPKPLFAHGLQTGVEG